MSRAKASTPEAWASPTPEAIRDARKAAGLTQTQAAAQVYSKLRTWQQWEAGDRKLHPAIWELFLLKRLSPPVPSPHPASPQEP